MGERMARVATAFRHKPRVSSGVLLAAAIIAGITMAARSARATDPVLFARFSVVQTEHEVVDRHHRDGAVTRRRVPVPMKVDALTGQTYRWVETWDHDKKGLPVRVRMGWEAMAQEVAAFDFSESK